MERAPEQGEPLWKQMLNTIQFTYPEDKTELETFLRTLEPAQATEAVHWLKNEIGTNQSDFKDIGENRITGFKDRENHVSVTIKEQEYQNDVTVNNVHIRCENSRSSGYGYGVWFPQLSGGGADKGLQHLERAEAIIIFTRSVELAKELGDARQVLDRLKEEFQKRY